MTNPDSTTQATLKEVRELLYGYGETDNCCNPEICENGERCSNKFRHELVARFPEIASLVEAQAKENDRLKKEHAQMLKSLKIYSDPSNWMDIPSEKLFSCHFNHRGNKGYIEAEQTLSSLSK